MRIMERSRGTLDVQRKLELIQREIENIADTYVFYLNNIKDDIGNGALRDQHIEIIMEVWALLRAQLQYILGEAVVFQNAE